jgi:hypothetical protein
MSIHHFFGKIILVSTICLLTSCSASKSLSSPTPSTSPDRETSLSENSYYSDFSSMNKLNGSIGIIKVREKEAYFDQKLGKLLKPFGYFQVMFPFREGLAGVSKGGKLGFINEQGEWVIPPRFSDDDVSHPNRTRFYDGIALIKIGNKDRFINKKGEFVTPAFDEASIFDQDVAVVVVNKKYGLINKQGKFIVSPQFTEYPRGSFDQGGMLVKVNGQEKCIDKLGAQAKADACKYLAEVPSAFEVKNSSVYLHGKLLPGYRWDKVIKTQNYNEYNASGGNVYKGLYIYVVGNKWGLVHESGEVRTPPQFDLTEPGDDHTIDNFYFGYSYFHNGLAQAKINGKYGFIDETGKFVIPPKFDNVESFKFDAKITTVKLGNKWGTIDRQGNFIIQPKFEYGLYFNGRFGTLALLIQKGKYGFVDRQGKIVTPATIDEIKTEDFASARGNHGFYDSLPNEGLAKARIGKKWGYVNTQGKIQIPMRFDEANDFRYGVAEVKLGSKTLYIDRQGNTLPF